VTIPQTPKENLKRALSASLYMKLNGKNEGEIKENKY